jgi:hypothetical protein
MSELKAMKEIAKSIRQAPTNIDHQQYRFLYATQCTNGRSKIGMSGVASHKRPEAILNCELEFSQVYYTQSFRWAHRCEQIVFRLLYQGRKPLLNCKCGTGTHGEWFTNDYFVVIATIQSVMNWMLKEPYEVVHVTTHDEAGTAIPNTKMRLKDIWNAELQAFEANLDTNDRRDWSDFFSLNLEADTASSLTQNFKSPVPVTSDYVVRYSSLEVDLPEGTNPRPGIGHMHSEPSLKISRSVPSTPEKSASSDNLPGQVRPAHEPQTMPVGRVCNLRFEDRFGSSSASMNTIFAQQSHGSTNSRRRELSAESLLVTTPNLTDDDEDEDDDTTAFPVPGSFPVDDISYNKRGKRIERRVPLIIPDECEQDSDFSQSMAQFAEDVAENMAGLSLAGGPIRRGPHHLFTPTKSTSGRRRKSDNITSGTSMTSLSPSGRSARRVSSAVPGT